MGNTDGLKRGGSPGRPRGSRNKKTLRMVMYFQDLLQEGLEDPECRKRLLEQIKTLSIDVKLLQLLCAYAHGRPTVAVDVTTRERTLAELITGTFRTDEQADDVTTH